MLPFISSQLLFYIAIFLVLFVPGYFLILATRLDKTFSPLESFVIAFSSSIIVVDFLVIVLGRSPLHITRATILGAIILFSAVCYVIYFFRRKKETATTSLEKSDYLPRKSVFLVVLLLLLTIFIKTIYFKDTIFPTTTDLGHHMYWAKTIAVTGNLPQYEKADIGEQLTIEKPQPIADFIIGEHLIFAAIALISGAGFISAFPALVLFLIHMMSVLAMFILARAVFNPPAGGSDHRDTIAIVTLFLIGPLWALASPQAKFVSGGVIGNTIGNLLIPLAILFFVRAFAEKKSALLAWALFISLGMAYTHHLSTFVFIFTAFFAVATFTVLNLKTILSDIREWIRLFLSPSVIAVIIMGIIFVFFLYMPTYLNSKAIDTAVGAPSKATRTGLTLTQLKTTAGEARFAFAIAGLLLLFFAKKLGRYSQAFLIGWIGALNLMSLRPDWLFVDIPSNRIASYIVFPTAIIAAYMVAYIFTAFRNRDYVGKNYLSPFFVMLTFFIFMIFIATEGFYDDAQSLNSASSTKGALQTYLASGYLAERSTAADIILKDHNYLAGDTWIKLFFMRGYNYPLSRGYFKRYQDDTVSREQCTNLMISTPNTSEAQRCFDGTQTDFLMINPKMDGAQFNRLKNFWRIYSSDDVGIFYKKS
jgi:hypothetical protein